MANKTTKMNQPLPAKPGVLKNPAGTNKGPGNLQTQCAVCGGRGTVSSPRGNIPCVACRGSGVAPIGNGGRLPGR